MANTGPKLLERHKGRRSEATEYAFLASVAALACEGRTAQAQELMHESQQWMRGESHATEVRFLPVCVS